MSSRQHNTNTIAKMYVATLALLAPLAAASPATGWRLSLPRKATAAREWKSVSPLPTPRHVVSLVTLPDGSVLALGGEQVPAPKISDAVERYFPHNDTWITLGRMPMPRDNFGAALYDGRVYCVGGQVGLGQNITASVDILDVASMKWSSGPSIPEARVGVRAVGLSDGVLAVGGFTFPFSPSSYHADTQRLKNGTWRATKTPLPYGRSNMGVTASSVSGQCFAVGGGATDAGYNTTAAFDPKTETWKPKGELSTARSYEGLAAIVIQGKEYVYAIGGMSQVPLFSPTQSVERMLVETGKWEDTTPLPHPAGGLAATTINNGTAILVVGGADAWIMSFA